MWRRLRSGDERRRLQCKALCAFLSPVSIANLLLYCMLNLLLYFICPTRTSPICPTRERERESKLFSPVLLLPKIQQNPAMTLFFTVVSYSWLRATHAKVRGHHNSWHHRISMANAHNMAADLQIKRVSRPGAKT